MTRRGTWGALGLLFGCGAALAQDGKEPAGIQRIRDRLPDLVKEVEGMRGEKLSREIKVVWKTDEDAKATIIKDADRDVPAARSGPLSRAYVRLGLLPAGYDLRAQQLDAGAASSITAYDSDASALFVMRPEANEVSLGPELFQDVCSAFQAQRVDLTRYLGDGEKDHDDQTLARRFVAEGEAHYLESLHNAKQHGAESTVPDGLDGQARLTRAQFADKQRRSAEAMGVAGKPLIAAQERTAKLPALSYHRLVDPFLKGSALVGKLVRLGGWRAVDELWAHPPNSTAQVLHWKKVWGEREEPIGLALPDLSATLGNGFKRSVEATLGEIGVRSLLEEHGVPEKDGIELAKGWRGDRLAAFREGRRRGRRLRDDLRVVHDVGERRRRAQALRRRRSAVREAVAREVRLDPRGQQRVRRRLLERQAARPGQDARHGHEADRRGEVTRESVN